MRKKNESRNYLIQIETKMKKNPPQTTQTMRRRSRQCRRLFVYTHTRAYIHIRKYYLHCLRYLLCGVGGVTRFVYTHIRAGMYIRKYTLHLPLYIISIYSKYDLSY